MQGLRTVLERSSLIACGALWLGLCHCGGSEFNAAPSAGAGNDSGGRGGASGNGGASSSGSHSGGANAGAGGSSGASAGQGGGSPSGCECPAGQYCLDGSTDCYLCSDLSRLYFDPPVRLATVSDNGPGSRFPRIGATSTDLIYHFDGVGMRYTADSSTSAGSSVTDTEPKDSAPLLLREPVKSLPVGGLEQFNFLFDRSVNDVRQLQVGTWSNGLQRSVEAPAPFNAGSGDFSIAVALHPAPGAAARAFWMTNRPSQQPGARVPRLVTASLEANASAVDVEVQLNVGSGESCAPLDVNQLPAGSDAIDPDMTPWVTSDGSLLVLSTTRLVAGCQAGAQKKDIYSALLQASSGQPPAPALAMKDVNSPRDDVDPSFSADMCDLYFASDRDGKFAVYRAHRR
jgi:hypothetical protein